MTTDITELAQSLKAAAEKATPGPWALARDRKTVVSNQSHPIANLSDAMHRMLADGTTGQDAEFISLANPANILALVEAQEKAQQRIAELEEAEHKLCAANVTLDARAEFAERQLAGLESRLESADKLQDSAFRSGLQQGFSLGQTDDQKGYEQSMAAYSPATGIREAE